MKYIFLLLITFNNAVSGQNQNNVWMLGYQTVYKEFGIDFSNGNADTFSVERPMSFNWTNASICDNNGNLLFYTNGIYVANKNHDTLFNSKDFNPGYLTDELGNTNLGLTITQGALILPFSGLNSRQYIFSVSAKKIFPPSGNDLQPIALKYSIVDINLDGGLGGVTQKNITCIEDTLTFGRMTACKHANGRDWWLVNHKFESDEYFITLVTSDSVYQAKKQNIGHPIIYDAIGMACFSPDGSKYAMIGTDPDDTLDIFSFDRCAGSFSNPVSVILPDYSYQSCAFSSDSRFLYVASYLHLYQIDMLASDIPSSIQEVGVMTDSLYFITPLFSNMVLAPDNKIYISTYGSTPFLHVIEYPDSFGIACGYNQEGMVLPTYNNASVPNAPNYELGALIGSPCDTLYLGNVSTANKIATFRISPNPVNDWLNIVYLSEEDGVLTLVDINGKKVACTSLFRYFKNRLLNLSHLPAGVYLAVVTQNGEKMWSEKVVVAH